MTPSTRDRIERSSKWLALATDAGIILCLLVPFLILAITKLVNGIVTGTQPERGGIVWTPDLPRFDPQLWLVWVPIALVALWIVVTIPVPLQRTRGFGRLMQLLTVIMVLFGTILVIVAYFPMPGVTTWGTEWAPSVILVIGAVVLLRMLLGALRLLPRSWRIYLDENGDPEPPRRPGQAPMSEIPQ